MPEPARIDPAFDYRRGRAPEGRPPGFVAIVTPWFIFLGGAAAWVLHLVLAYAIAEVACQTDRLDGVLLGMPMADVFGYALTLLAGLTALAAGVLAYGRLAEDPRGDPVDDPGAHEVLGRRRFMTYVGLLMNGLFLIAILAGGLPFLYLRSCSGS
jgi:hypothetical protein